MAAAVPVAPSLPTSTTFSAIDTPIPAIADHARSLVARAIALGNVVTT